MTILAIDPGNEQSAYCIIDSETFKPQQFAKLPNNELLQIIADLPMMPCAIEMISHYGTGMPAGETVFDTCIWIGRFTQLMAPLKPTYIKRPAVKTHICRSVRATDANVSQALVDRFAKGERNHGKGVDKAPGFFYGFKADIWAAYAVGLTYIETKLNRE